MSRIVKYKKTTTEEAEVEIEFPYYYSTRYDDDHGGWSESFYKINEDGFEVRISTESYRKGEIDRGITTDKLDDDHVARDYLGACGKVDTDSKIITKAEFDKAVASLQASILKHAS